MDETFDVVVIGAGINGAAVCHVLTMAGYRVLLADQGDIGSGTSQASTMLIWGGLLYLKHLELATVHALSRDRDHLVASRPGSVQACPVIYLPTPGSQPSALVRSALELYWMLGRGKRTRPETLSTFDEQAALATPDRQAFQFEEATLRTSDARFVLEWALEAEQLGAVIGNYLRADTALPDGNGDWRIGLCDVLTGAMSEVTARCVINAAGCWTDAVNARAKITTPFRHVFSRGVSLAFPRPAWHTRHLVLDSSDADVMTLAPWGPVSLWGSTDTLVPDLAQARQPATRDPHYLLRELNQHLGTAVSIADVVSLRTGVRPIPVAHDAPPPAAGDALTRHHRLHLDDRQHWISVYGGKISGCTGLAAEVQALVAQRLAPSAPAATEAMLTAARAPAPAVTSFPSLTAPVVSPRWAAEHEHCCTLGDYLRRRTNIAQWVPNGGFGASFEHAEALEQIALELHGGNAGLAERDLSIYWNDVYDRELLLRERRSVPRPPLLPWPQAPLTHFSTPHATAPPHARPRTQSRSRSATARWRRE